MEERGGVCRTPSENGGAVRGRAPAKAYKGRWAHLSSKAKGLYVLQVSILAQLGSGEPFANLREVLALWRREGGERRAR